MTVAMGFSPWVSAHNFSVAERRLKLRWACDAAFQASLRDATGNRAPGRGLKPTATVKGRSATRTCFLHTLLAFAHDPQHRRRDFVHRFAPVHLTPYSLVTVVLDERHELVPVEPGPLPNRFGLVVFADDQRLAATVAPALAHGRLSLQVYTRPQSG